jgi:ribose 5-phosphate isomerase B
LKLNKRSAIILIMKVYIGSDHHGQDLRPKIASFVIELGFECEDLGMSSDFPVMAQHVAKKILETDGSIGILMCWTGQGMAMAANRFSGIRAAVCNSIDDARQTREHLDANIITLSGDRIGSELVKEIVKTFLTTEFSKKERYVRRIEQIG